MDNNELLLAISTMMDIKLAHITKDVQDLKAEMRSMKAEMLNMKSAIQNLESKMQNMDLRIKRIEVDLLENNIIPRLNTIEKCYVDTSYRYRDSVEDYEAMKLDIDVIKKVVTDHSKALQKIS